MQSDTRYFMAALGYGEEAEAAPSASVFRPKLVNYEHLRAEELSAFQCVVLADVPRLPADLVQKLARYVNSGGGLWIALGEQTDVAAFNQAFFEQNAGLSPLPLREPAGDADDHDKAIALVPPSADHPATALLADTHRLDIDRVRIYRRHQFDADTGSSVTVLLRAEGGAPVAVERDLGRGRVIVMAIPLGLAWSNLPLSHSYVVMVHEWLWYLTEPGLVKRNLQAGEVLQAGAPVETSNGSALPGNTRRTLRPTVWSRRRRTDGVSLCQDPASGRISIDALRHREKFQLGEISGRPGCGGIEPHPTFHRTDESLDGCGRPGVRGRSSFSAPRPENHRAAQGAGHVALDGIARVDGVGNRRGLVAGPPSPHRRSGSGHGTGHSRMTPTPNTATLQKFALEGPLSVEQLVLLGTVVALLIGFFAWRDYKAAASRKLLVFLVLPRLAALLVVLWMLAGPSVVKVARQFKPKSIVILADGSGSMGLVDAVDGSGNTLRWSEEQSIPALATLDQVVGTLRSAQSSVAQIRQTHHAADDLEPVHRSLDSAANELGQVNLDPARTDSETRAEFGRLSAFLKDGVAHLSGSATRQNQNDRLDEMDAFIEGGSRRVERLSQKVASQYEKAPLSNDQPALAAESKRTRQDKVIGWLGGAEDSWLKELSAKVRVLRYKFASDVLPVPDPDWRAALTGQTNLDTRGTDLGAALNRAAQDASQQSVNAVVLVTDGGHNAPGDPREMAASLREVPLFIVPIGSSVIPRDVILHHMQCPKAAFKNDNVMVDAMVTAYYCQGEQVRVELLSDNEVVDSQTVAVSSAVFDGRVSFRWKAAVLGRHVLKVRAVPVPRELSLDNNEAQAEVEVMENTVRVLLADDLPRWEFRYLSMLFKRDKHVEFDQLLFEPNDDSQPAAGELSFPQDAEGWRKYRVVILGDVTPAQLSPVQQELLRKYVAEDGGSLVVIAGETAMPAAFAGQPLDAMIPVTEAAINPDQAFSLAVTAEGSVSAPTQLDDDPLASDRIWRETSSRLPVYNLSPVSHPKPTSHVLIAAATSDPGAGQRAFLSWQYVGLGRVIYIAAPITYELRYGRGDLYHHRFWGQLLRWAVARGNDRWIENRPPPHRQEPLRSGRTSPGCSSPHGQRRHAGRRGTMQRRGFPRKSLN